MARSGEESDRDSLGVAAGEGVSGVWAVAYKESKKCRGAGISSVRSRGRVRHIDQDASWVRASSLAAALEAAAECGVAEPAVVVTWHLARKISTMRCPRWLRTHDGSYARPADPTG